VTFPEEMLNDGEDVLLDLRPHWWFIAPASAGLVAALIFGSVALGADWPDPIKFLAGIVVLFALGYFVVRFVRWAGINFVVTSERIVSRKGVIAKKGIEIPLDRVNTVFFNQGIFERIIGAGDLGIESAGEGGRQNFEDIRRPRHVQQEIYRAMEADETSRFQHMGQVVAASGGGAQGGEPSIPEQIEQLDDLRKRGALTQEEFDEKKRELLGRL